MNGYDSPKPPPLPWQQAPPVLKWFKVYCFAMAFLYILLMVFGIVALIIDPDEFKMQRSEARVMGATFTILGLLLAAPFFAAPFLPQKKWVWTYDLVLIGLGMTSLCCLPATVPLLIWWLKPETKLFFEPR